MPLGRSKQCDKLYDHPLPTSVHLVESMTFPCFYDFFFVTKNPRHLSIVFRWGEEGGGGSCLFAALFGLVRNMVKMTTTASMKRLDVLDMSWKNSNHFHQTYIYHICISRTNFWLSFFDHQWLVTFNKNQVGHELTGSFDRWFKVSKIHPSAHDATHRSLVSEMNHLKNGVCNK